MSLVPSRVTRRGSSWKSGIECQVLKGSSYLELSPVETGSLLIIQENHRWLGLEGNLEIVAMKLHLHTKKTEKREAPSGGVTLVRSHSMLPFSSVCHGEFLPICIYYSVPWDKLLLAFLSAIQVYTMTYFLSFKTNVALPVEIEVPRRIISSLG